MTLSYRRAVAALTERGRFGISLGLERVERLMDEVGHPERGLRGALVGGTNGKGSVVAMTQSVLTAAGLRDRQHAEAAPRQLPRADRDRRPADLAGGLRDGGRARAAGDRPGRGGPSVHRRSSRRSPPRRSPSSARQRVDLAIVEVGLGGRLDATNVLDLGVAAITNVQLDHEAILGPTLTAIGGEKAPIIKSGNLAVTGASGRGLRPILDRCASLDVPLLRAGPRQPYRATLRETGWDGIVVDARTPSRRLDGAARRPPRAAPGPRTRRWRWA